MDVQQLNSKSQSFFIYGRSKATGVTHNKLEQIMNIVEEFSAEFPLKRECVYRKSKDK